MSENVSPYLERPKREESEVRAARKYMPSSGMEGADFIERFCRTCQLDVTEECPILSNALIRDLRDPQYPSEWTYDSNGPVCTSYRSLVARGGA